LLDEKIITQRKRKNNLELIENQSEIISLQNSELTSIKEEIGTFIVRTI
jgi:hypothetical protein